MAELPLASEVTLQSHNVTLLLTNRDHRVQATGVEKGLAMPQFPWHPASINTVEFTAAMVTEVICW